MRAAGASGEVKPEREAVRSLRVNWNSNRRLFGASGLNTTIVPGDPLEMSTPTCRKTLACRRGRAQKYDRELHMTESHALTHFGLLASGLPHGHVTYATVFVVVCSVPTVSRTT